MNLNLVRGQIDLLRAGATVAGDHNVKLYTSPPRPFLLHPKKPSFILDQGWTHIRLTSDLTRFHFQSMGTEVDQVTLGDLDFMLTLKTEEEVFAPFLHAFKEKAVRATDWNGIHLQDTWKNWCGIAAVDVLSERIRFMGWVPMNMDLVSILER